MLGYVEVVSEIFGYYHARYCIAKYGAYVWERHVNRWNVNNTDEAEVKQKLAVFWRIYLSKLLLIVNHCEYEEGYGHEGPLKVFYEPKLLPLGQLENWKVDNESNCLIEEAGVAKEAPVFDEDVDKDEHAIHDTEHQ